MHSAITKKRELTYTICLDDNTKCNSSLTNEQEIDPSVPCTTHAHRCMKVARPSNFIFSAKMHNDTHLALVCPIIAPNLKIKEIASHVTWHIST